MDLDDHLPLKSADPVAQLGRQDLDRLSVDELRERIETLEAEIGRTRAKLEGATRFRSEADSLFRKS